MEQKFIEAGLTPVEVQIFSEDAVRLTAEDIAIGQQFVSDAIDGYTTILANPNIFGPEVVNRMREALSIPHIGFSDRLEGQGFQLGDSFGSRRSCFTVECCTPPMPRSARGWPFTHI